MCFCYFRSCYSVLVLAVFLLKTNIILICYCVPVTNYCYCILIVVVIIVFVFLLRYLIFLVIISCYYYDPVNTVIVISVPMNN